MLFRLLIITANLFLINPTRSETLKQITKPVDHAEGPIWDHRKDILYYVDIHTGTLHSYHYFTKETNQIKFNGDLAIVAPTKNDADLLILGLNRSLIAVEWNGRDGIKKSKNLTTISQQYPTSRFNDGKADCNGNLWFGTMGYEDPKTGQLQPNQGLLYRFDRNYQQPQIMIQPVNISNGLAWNRMNDRFFYIDSPSRQIIVYDFDKNKSTIHNPRKLFDLNRYQLNGVPDGMTIDIHDNLWVALFGGHSIIQIDTKTGKLLKRFEIPARDVTSVMWGGPLYDILYVTTSRFNLNETERLQQPLAGSVFALEDLNTKGYEIHLADITNGIA